MSGHNFIVPPLSWLEIRTAATQLREVFGFGDEPYLPVIDVLESGLDHGGLLSLEIAPIDEMGDAEGLACPQGKFIRIREDVYEAACDQEPRARFTIAHEIGHWYLHSNVQLMHARTDSRIENFRLSEPQANQFAAEFLMPVEFFSDRDDAFSVTCRHGVSHSAALYRLKYLMGEGII